MCIRDRYYRALEIEKGVGEHNRIITIIMLNIIKIRIIIIVDIIIMCIEIM